jgi:CBS domain-containing protein
MLVRDVMTRLVHTAGAHWTLEELKTFLLEHGISGAPVVDSAGRLAGVVSTTDLVRASSAALGTDQSPGGYFATSLDRPLSAAELGSLQIEGEGEQRVRDVMTPVVFQTESDTPLDEVADIMIQGHIHRVIVTKDGAVTGIVSALDLVRALRDLMRGRLPE